ncbi:MAG: wax ester/triacylglycerol synthase family O-acyltransferase [Chromatiales bacterium]|jgi:WS/DGAT/MGAT family acyltransferase|nr:wax ester/triacylglycerol synthase family O-acyltransferase [Chromatiales bacterium]
MPTLSFYDYAFLLTETADSPKHVAGVQIFRPPADYDGDYVSDLIEAMKKRPAGPPFDFKLKSSLLSKPEWVQDDNFDLDYHVRRSRLPKPGSRHQLMELVGRLHSILLDRQRPLWEIHIIDGLEDGCFALYVKIHHSYCDGATLVRLLIETLNTSADDQRIRANWEATHTATFREDSRDIGSKVDRGVGLFRRTVETVTDLGGLVGRMTMQRLGLQPGHLPVPFTAPKTRLNSVVTRARRAAVGELPLDELKAISKGTDTTLNDVVVTICDIALTRYLRRHHQTPKGPLVAQMPVSLRRDGNAQMGNQLAILPVTLGRVGQDPVRRLKAVSRSAAEVKEDAAAMSPDAVSLYTLAMQGAAQAGELLGVAESLPPLGNILISNVPGPRVPLYLWGAKLVSAYPLSAIPPGLSMNITVFSYDGKFDIGFIAGYDAVSDIEVLPEFIDEAFEALKSATQRHLLRARKSRSKARGRGRRAANKANTRDKTSGLSTPPKKTVARKKKLTAARKTSSGRTKPKVDSGPGLNGRSRKKAATSRSKVRRKGTRDRPATPQVTAPN